MAASLSKTRLPENQHRQSTRRTVAANSRAPIRPAYARFRLLPVFPPETFQRPAGENPCSDVEHVPVIGRVSSHALAHSLLFTLAGPPARKGVGIG
jgi:hypothetical protein